MAADDPSGRGQGEAGARFDFHIHTRHSDGARTVAEVLSAASAAGLAGIAIADHDTADAHFDPAVSASRSGPRLLPAVEVSAFCGEGEVHILGYFPAGFSPGFLAFLDELIAARRRRIVEGLDRLRDRGIDLRWEDLQRESGGRVVSRGHLARVLVERRMVPSVHFAFDHFLGHDTFDTPGVEAAEAIGEISKAGGLAILAHPNYDLLDRELERFRAAGLAGVELHIPRRRAPERQRMVARLAEAKEGSPLVTTGGSDWHGFAREAPLGRFAVRPDQIGDFLRAIGWA